MKRAATILIVLGAILVIGFLFFPMNQGTAPIVPVSSEITYTNTSSDMITVELPFPRAVTGKDGNHLTQGIAQARGEWMTTEFVPFKADIKIPESYIGPATLILKKDNPSGLLEHDASISFPFTIEY